MYVPGGYGGGRGGYGDDFDNGEAGSVLKACLCQWTPLLTRRTIMSSGFRTQKCLHVCCSPLQARGAITEAGQVTAEAVEGTEAAVRATGITAAVSVEAATEVTGGTEVWIEMS